MRRIERGALEDNCKAPPAASGLLACRWSNGAQWYRCVVGDWVSGTQGHGLVHAARTRHSDQGVLNAGGPPQGKGQKTSTQARSPYLKKIELPVDLHRPGSLPLYPVLRQHVLGSDFQGPLIQPHCFLPQPLSWQSRGTLNLNHQRKRQVVLRHLVRGPTSGRICPRSSPTQARFRQSPPSSRACRVERAAGIRTGGGRGSGRKRGGHCIGGGRILQMISVKLCDPRANFAVAPNPGSARRITGNAIFF